MGVVQVHIYRGRLDNGPLNNIMERGVCSVNRTMLEEEWEWDGEERLDDMKEEACVLTTYVEQH